MAKKAIEKANVTEINVTAINESINESTAKAENGNASKEETKMNETAKKATTEKATTEKAENGNASKAENGNASKAVNGNASKATAKAENGNASKAARGKKAVSIPTTNAITSESTIESTHVSASAIESAKAAAATPATVSPSTTTTSDPETLKAIAKLLGIADTSTKAIVNAVRKAAGEKERATRVSDCESFTSKKKLVAKYPDMDTNQNYPLIFRNAFTFAVFPGSESPEKAVNGSASKPENGIASKPEFIAVTYFYSKGYRYEYRAYKLDQNQQAIADSVISADSIQELKSKVREAMASTGKKAEKTA